METCLAGDTGISSGNVGAMRSADFDTVTKPVPGLDAESVVPIDGLHRIAVFDEVFTVLWNAASDLPL